MLPKFISDILFPTIVLPPTELVETYAAEVLEILMVLKVPAFKVTDNTKISSLFYSNSQSARGAFSEPKMYNEFQMQEAKMDSLKFFSALVKLFDGVCVVSLNDKVVDLAKNLHEEKLRTALVKELV